MPETCKLLSKLEKAGQPAPRRMGFVPPSAESTTPPLALVLRIDSGSSKLLAQAKEVADSVILRVESLDKAKPLLKEMSKLSESLPWGIQWAGAETVNVEELVEKGCDFLVFGVDDTPATVLNEENLGKVLSIGISLEEALLRVLEDTPADCLLIEAEPKERLSVRDLMSYRVVLSSVTKPVMVRTRLDLDVPQLTALENVGIVAAVVEPRTPDDIKMAAELRKAIQGLPPREESERRRVEALVPPLSPVLAPAPPPDEDDE